ncbi:hypothetical protein DPMN_080731 [Dreissena polymorpha]|uniref:Uncharacterized protein n=1 Tax=Dreissena polymorpha TaxID=45954 RepID=A0A9D3YVQ8_DREPO|nr:hypothetical protein DPMN_080731 [Dreissena polymorpha]
MWWSDVWEVWESPARVILPDSEDLCLEVNSTKSKECQTSPEAGVLLCYNHIPENPVAYSAVVVVACTVINPEMKETHFLNANWSLVQRFTYTKPELESFVLNIGPFAFRPMKNLNSLYIDNLKGKVNFNNESFCGLGQLKKINLIRSLDLGSADIGKLFSSNCSLPQSLFLLRTLFLTK